MRLDSLDAIAHAAQVELELTQRKACALNTRQAWKDVRKAGRKAHQARRLANRHG